MHAAAATPAWGRGVDGFDRMAPTGEIALKRMPGVAASMLGRGAGRVDPAVPGVVAEVAPVVTNGAAPDSTVARTGHTWWHIDSRASMLDCTR